LTRGGAGLQIVDGPPILVEDGDVNGDDVDTASYVSKGLAGASVCIQSGPEPE